MKKDPNTHFKEGKHMKLLKQLVLAIWFFPILICLTGCFGGSVENPAGPVETPLSMVSSRAFGRGDGSNLVSLNKESDNLNTLSMQIRISGIPSHFTTSALVKTVDGRTKELKKASLPFEGVVLAADDVSVVGVTAFKTLSFSCPIPEGAKVEVYDNDNAGMAPANTFPKNSSIRTAISPNSRKMDYNGDGVVNSHDIIIYFAWYVVSEKKPEAVQAQARTMLANVSVDTIVLPDPLTDDLNGDGVLNSQDAAILIAWYQVRSSDKTAILARAWELFPGITGQIVRLPGEQGSNEVVLDKMVSGLNSYNCQIFIRNVGADYSNSVALDCVNAANSSVQIPWNIGKNITTDNGVVLVCVLMDFFSLSDFDRLYFTKYLASGTYVEVINRDTGLVVARSETVASATKTLSGISFNPASATITVNETYALSNIEVTASYDDSSSSVVTSNLSWSGTGVSGNSFSSSTAGTISLNCTYVENDVSKSALFSVIVNAASGTVRFSKDSQGIITDKYSGRQWYCSSAHYSWYQARDWANNLTVGGSGWRLATLAELQMLYPEAWATGMFTNFWTWSADLKDSSDSPATTYDDTTAWLYDIYSGNSYWGYRDNHNNLCSYNVLAVRIP
jgi:hypothetical protein